MEIRRKVSIWSTSIVDALGLIYYTSSGHCHRLAEEIDKKTDVHAKGMQGFYANLFTKNVAMGNSVEENALSAFTTGSSRLNHLDNKETVSVVASGTQASSSSGSKSSDKGHQRDEIEVRKESKSASNVSSSVDTDKSEPRDQSDREMTEGAKAVGETKDAKETKTSREEQIRLAKERYLARKRTIDQTT